MTGESVSTKAQRPFWRWVAMASGAVLAVMEAQRLLTMIRWERTLPFARDFLPGAIATSAMALAAYLLVIGLMLTRRGRKWGMALAIAWGTIVAGTTIWVWAGPHVKNLACELAFHFHWTKTVMRFRTVRGAGMLRVFWISGLAALLGASSAKAFADSPRERLDLGILLASMFYAAFYFLALGIVARLVTPH
ncbi:MAG: hypothetical protein KGL59_09705 [Acidobacteriota bacterium]|nr:hypothetical protein [Acidobacteriota bacterium]